MSERLKHRLSIVAVIAVVVSLISFSVVNRQFSQVHNDAGETRPVVDAAVTKIQMLHPSSLDEQSFRKTLEKLPQTQYVFGI